MSSIDPSERLATLLRNQVSALRGRSAAMQRSAAPASSPPGQAAASVAAQRIQSLSPDDPDRKKKALRIYLESVLLQEFGANLVHDPSFAEMVDAVQQQMQADQQLAAVADELSGLLVAGAGRGQR
jgi:hypothetical protein